MISNLGSISNLLSTSLTQSIQKAFSDADSDGDGMLNKSEFETFISNSPAPPIAEGTSLPDIATIFTAADTNGDGGLTLSEIEDAAPPAPTTETSFNAAVSIMDMSITQILPGSSGNSSKTSIFNYLDTNKDGVVTIDEILAVYSKNASEMYSMIQESTLISGTEIDINA